MSKSPGSGESDELTPQQRAAATIEAGVSVALTASAGCGKTKVLTERYLAELDHVQGRALDRVVALTFTDKAANELKERIRGRLRDRLDSGVDRDRALDLLRGLEAAPIGTFHEYCGRLVRRFALELGIDPDFAVLEPDVASSIREDAVNHTLRELLDRKDEDLIDLAHKHGLSAVRESIDALISRPADFAAFASLGPDELIALWTAARDRDLLPLALRKLRGDLAPVRDALAAVETSNGKVIRLRGDAFAAIDDLNKADPGDPGLIERIKEIRETLKVQKVQKQNWPSIEDHDRIMTLFESARKTIGDLLAPWTAPTPKADLDAARESLAYTKLAIQARAAYERFKERRGGLDFDDLLTRARDLLRDGLVGEAGAGLLLDVVMVDEFQDTDHVQNEILKHLGGPKYTSGRVFVVGDVKQSIYGFRGAEPGLFTELRQAFPERGRLALTESFRSVPGVTRFVNALFRGCFTDLHPESVADPTAYDLRPARKANPSEPAVEFVWARLAETEPANDAETPPGKNATADQGREAEAAVLAARIRERLDAGWMIHDPKTNQTRPAEAGDVAFLFRAMTDLRHYETALARRGFDYYTVGGSAFYAQQEVRDVANLLACLEDPLDEPALAGVLRGPFVGLSDDSVYLIASRGGGLVEGFARFEVAPELPPQDRARAERGADLLARWRGLKDRVSMARLLETVFDESGYEGALLCEFMGERKSANARKLITMARSFDRQGGFTLGALAARLRSLLDQGAREEQATATQEGAGCLRLMSIHQAKGLEFPIVVVPDLTRDLNTRLDGVCFHRSLGVVAAKPASADGHGLARLVLKVVERIEAEAESLRLFYTAATRARDALVFSAAPAAGQASSSPVWTLLNRKFEAETGRALDCQGAPPPTVAVHQAAPPDDLDRRLATRKTTPLEKIERAITGAARIPEPAIQTRVSRPGAIDLDQACELGPAEGGIDRVIRAIITSDGWSRGESVEEIASRAAVSLVPAASARAVAAALDRMQPWTSSALLELFKSAAPRLARRRVAVAAPLPTPEGRPVVLRAACDLVFEGGDGIVRALIATSSAAHPAHARLTRWLVAETAAVWTPATTGEVWLFEHGPDGRLAIAPPPADPRSLAGDLDALTAQCGKIAKMVSGHFFSSSRPVQSPGLSREKMN